MSEKKTRSHHIMDNHPFIGTVLGTLILVPLFIAISSGASMLLGTALKNEPVCTGTSILISYIVCSLIFAWWFKGETSGLIFGGSITSSFIVGVMLVVYWVLSLVQGYILAGDTVAVPTIENIATSVSAGFFEEPLCRGFFIMLFLRNKRTPGKIIGSLIFTTIVFALLHVSNLKTGAELIPTVVQVINSIGTGLIFGLLFVRSGNLLPASIMHMAHDIIALSTVGKLDNIPTYGGLEINVIINMVMCFILGVVGFIYITRRSVMEETISVWDTKWKT